MSNVGSIADSAVLVRCRLSKWEGFKYDAQLTKQFIDSHGAERGSARINKLIVPKDWIDPCTRAFNQLYQYVKSITMPWLDNGERLLVGSLIMDFGDKVRELRYEIDLQVDRLDRTYPDMLRDQPLRMNGLWKAGDYPNHSELKSLFNVNVSFLPVPDADIRLSGVSQVELDAMNAAKEQEIKRAIAGTIEDQYRRAYDAVLHLAERMKEYDERERAKASGKEVGRTGIFRDSVVDNIKELVDVLPKFNFTNDPKLTALTNRLSREICTFDAEVLRESSNTRTRVQLSAADILKQMEGYVS